MVRQRNGVKIEAIRWTINRAAEEFGIDGRTLHANLRQHGILAGRDGLFSTMDIAKGIFGDLEFEKIRLTREQADIANIKKLEMRRDSIPAALVWKVWDATITELRQKISYAAIPDIQRSEILRDLKDVPIEEYFSAALKGVADEGEGDTEPA